MRRRSELVVVGLLFAAAACAAGFVAVYALGSIPRRTQFLGLSLGLSFALVAAALIVFSKHVVPQEQLEEDYPLPRRHEEDEQAVEQLVAESGEGITRKRLLIVGAGAAGTALGAALIAPAASLGPFLDVDSFFATPWGRGRRLVDEAGRPLRAADVEEGAFYTAYPEGADREQLAAPVVVVRLPTASLRLPHGRAGWAPGGILAYSKICTHAGCAIALYRKPTFPAAEPRPAFVCPCHYSTFDPATGGTVLFGPAGRPLPQLPLYVDAAGGLRAAGNFSGPVGPGWWGVRNRKATTEPT
ncbi:MAG TPA: Rieske 2Fe-2S domain-containing protein [Gaiellaceae bacterium]|nr:Rieske 2Fe-2S domain-containing protein [Gaiellaceae bacterium]